MQNLQSPGAFFALANNVLGSDKRAAFQASSPKTSWAGLLIGFFLVETGEARSAHAAVCVSALGEGTDQLVEAHLILCPRRKGVAYPIQAPCQKQHGSLSKFFSWRIS
jgi:hypothetical protein